MVKHFVLFFRFVFVYMLAVVFIVNKVMKSPAPVNVKFCPLNIINRSKLRCGRCPGADIESLERFVLDGPADHIAGKC